MPEFLHLVGETMNCVWCWIVGALVALYAADAAFPDWNSFDCKGGTVGGINLSPTPASELESRLGRHFAKPSVERCEFKSGNSLRNVIEKFR